MKNSFKTDIMLKSAKDKFFFNRSLLGDGNLKTLIKNKIAS